MNTKPKFGSRGSREPMSDRSARGLGVAITCDGAVGRRTGVRQRGGRVAGPDETGGLAVCLIAGVSPQ